MTTEKPTDCWRTPQWLRIALCMRTDVFDLDAAASADNAVCDYRITREQDALGPEPWSEYVPPWHAKPLCIFLNPPFSKLGAFVARAIAECKDHGHTIALITLADISTAYWRLLERPPPGVDVERVRIRGRWSCDPPPGISVSTPTRPMAAWILRPELVPPRRAKRPAP